MSDFIATIFAFAADLRVSEGQVGQAIAISGVFAVLTSLSISALAGRLDRKLLLLVLTAVMALSGSIVALAPNYEISMIGRALFGVVIGGFWSMSTATAMRLVPEQHVPKALAIFNGGNALATVVAPPAGALLGATIGWRGAFFLRRPDRGHRFRLADDQHAVDAGRASARIRQHVQAVQQADLGSRPALPRDGHTRRCLDTAVRVGRHRYCRPHRYKPDQA
ncbi:MFS transporter [Agrobacterium pusense]|uniref:MFS transporter n=1 Tax=Agrobacterium pusense TaxID=648995 RepID=UPI003FD32F0A